MQDFLEGPWAQSNLDAGAALVIPVPAPHGGAVVVGESVIAYFSEGQPMKCTQINETIVKVTRPVSKQRPLSCVHGHL